jgi:hypothetical protein
MIIYYDTSALLKIDINETYSDLVRQIISDNKINYISTLSYVEINSVFSRCLNDGQISEEELIFFKSSFNNDFKIFQKIPIDLNILKRAAELTYSSGLRTLDSIHLASIEYLKLTANDELVFACFDKKLNEGAKELGINIIKY